MSKIVISFCIPTFNRAKWLYTSVNHILQYKNDDIEIVISDNASPDNTKKIIQSIKDPRVKYHRHPENLGFDLNLIQCIEMSKGDFIFILSDDDVLELKEVPWLIETMKNNKNLSQIIGSLGDYRPGGKNYIIKDEEFTSGEHSLGKLTFRKSYLGGTILKRDVLDIDQAKKYLKFNYIHQVFMLQAIIKGNTICTSKILNSTPKDPAKSKAVSLSGYSKGRI